MAGSLSDLTDRKRIEHELCEKIELIQQQKEAIRVLSTPIIDVWEGVLMTAVLGVLDRDQTALMMESLLEAVLRAGCRYVIIDLTAVASIDAATADHRSKLVRGVELLGAEGLVVGIQPEVARAIVSSGIDLSQITTRATLRQALLWCMTKSKAPTLDGNS